MGSKSEANPWAYAAWGVGIVCFCMLIWVLIPSKKKTVTETSNIQKLSTLDSRWTNCSSEPSCLCANKLKLQIFNPDSVAHEIRVMKLNEPAILKTFTIPPNTKDTDPLGSYEFDPATYANLNSNQVFEITSVTPESETTGTIYYKYSASC